MKKKLKSYRSLKRVENRVRDGKLWALYVDCFDEFWLKSSRWSLSWVKYTPTVDESYAGRDDYLKGSKWSNRGLRVK